MIIKQTRVIRESISVVFQILTERLQGLVNALNTPPPTFTYITEIREKYFSVIN